MVALKNYYAKSNRYSNIFCQNEFYTSISLFSRLLRAEKYCFYYIKWLNPLSNFFALQWIRISCFFLHLKRHNFHNFFPLFRLILLFFLFFSLGRLLKIEFSCYLSNLVQFYHISYYFQKETKWKRKRKLFHVSLFVLSVSYLFSLIMFRNKPMSINEIDLL